MKYNNGNIIGTSRNTIRTKLILNDYSKGHCRINKKYYGKKITKMQFRINLVTKANAEKEKECK